MGLVYISGFSFCVLRGSLLGYTFVKVRFRIDVCIYVYVKPIAFKYRFSNLKTQSIISFSASLLPRFVEKRPIRMRLENGLNDTPNVIGCIYTGVPRPAIN